MYSTSWVHLDYPGKAGLYLVELVSSQIINWADTSDTAFTTQFLGSHQLDYLRLTIFASCFQTQMLLFAQLFDTCCL